MKKRSRKQQQVIGSLHKPTDVCMTRARISHGFVSLADARAVIEAWWRKYNQERPNIAVPREADCLCLAMRHQIGSIGYGVCRSVRLKAGVVGNYMAMALP
ncbi:integrase core domain-containing protein [Thiobacillus sp.]|uniref:integrase core domain-containing protein n=1 Tax=Thiobacillus sp. TaxID=924 RepID=UPI0011D5D501|nr:integrase core domain-containing protein [Thiobacillus sp.]TXH76750.1 MAG: hypothetical protein E6Q82_01265 [Thiobacillus sp.]